MTSSPFNPSCPFCGGTDCDHIDEFDFVCNECKGEFTHEDERPEFPIIPDGDSLDMQEFDDKMSCIGDD